MRTRALYHAALFAFAACVFSWTIFLGIEFWFIPTFVPPEATAALLLTQLLGHYLGMMGPAVAALGLWSVYKNPTCPAFRWGNLKFYVWSAAALVLLRGAALACGMFAAPNDFQLRASIEAHVWFILGASLTFGWVAGMGEEVGWCAYLLPLLEPAFGKLGAAMFSGALRGVWHLPVIVTPLLVQVLKNETTWDFFIANALIATTALLFSNLLFGAAMSWLWFKTASVALVGWAHQWFDLTRDAAMLFVFALASSSATTLTYSIEIHLLGLAALLWIVRRANWQHGINRLVVSKTP
ncbi:MAG: hypothetical protein HDKAJFGB_01915 [Anaerolineae bacterium]|nr:hypothetical protein [Anaerolineae bacterium]